MARILFLPDETTVILLQSTHPADRLLAMVRSGLWRPPAPYSEWLQTGGYTLNATSAGSLVVIQVSCGCQAPDRPAELRVPVLSQRQLQVLQYLAEGLKQSEIARRIGISPRTVSAHINSIKARLGVRTTAQTIGRAAALGLVRMKRREDS